MAQGGHDEAEQALAGLDGPEHHAAVPLPRVEQVQPKAGPWVNVATDQFVLERAAGVTQVAFGELPRGDDGRGEDQAREMAQLIQGI